MSTMSMMHGPSNRVPASFVDLVDHAFAESADNRLSETHAVAVMQHGELIFERYRPGFDPTSTFITWSMAKSMTSALCGVMVDRGLLDLDAPSGVPEWQEPGDPRSAITLRHLLAMRSGLEWSEDYVDDQVSDVIDMLFGSGKHDVAAHAAAKPLVHEPGSHWYYSSGTTNIVARILGAALGGRDAMEAALQNDVFKPAGMTGAIPKFDDAGTFIGSSFVYATARDYLAFGELFRNRGQAHGHRVVSEAWVAESVREQAVCPDTGQGYGLHWWLARDEHGSFSCNGYEGQRIYVVPDLGLTFVRLGKTNDEFTPDLRTFCADIVGCLA